MTKVLYVGLSAEITDTLVRLSNPVLVATIDEAETVVVDSKFAPQFYIDLAATVKECGLHVYLIISDINHVPNVRPLVAVAKGIFGNVAQICGLANITSAAPTKEDIVNALTILWDQAHTNIFVLTNDLGVYVRPDFGGYICQEAVPVVTKVLDADVANVFSVAAIAKLLSGDSVDDAAKQATFAVALHVSGQQINQPNILALQATAASAAKPNFCPQFAAIATHSKPLKESDLLIPPQQLREFLEYKKFPADRPSDLIPQLSAAGLALVADAENHRKDQEHHFPIVVASRTVDMLSIIAQVNAAMNGEKVVVVFQATDGMSAGYFWCNLHKVVIYLEKRDDKLHVLFVDVISLDVIPEYIQALIRKALPENTDFVFYKQRQLPHPIPEKNYNLFLQTSFTHCGPHAMRIAHKIAQCADLLGNLVLDDHPHNAVRYYELPAFIAVNASSGLMQQAVLTLFSDRAQEAEKLAAKFTKHQDEPYAVHFSRKYLRFIERLVAEKTPDELEKALHAADARNYYPRLV